MKKIKNKLSIAIPTYNEEIDLKTCLEAISSQDYPKKLFEIIIIDNYSTDKTLSVAKSFSKKINIKILNNKIKDAEVSKKIGFDNSDGEFFMYLDADMRFSDKDFIKKMLRPLQEEKDIVGVFVRFLVSKNHPSLTRTLSYDEFQRDPIFRFFTVGIDEIIKERKLNYAVCECNEMHIPPQGLMIYRRDLVEDYVKSQNQLIDNEIPAVLIKRGYRKFAFVEDTGVEHLLLRSLNELWRKRVRNLERTYYPNQNKREFKWISWKKDWPKIGIWMLYTNSIIFPVISAIYKSIKYKDLCFFNEPVLNLVSTYSIIWGVLSIKKGKKKEKMNKLEYFGRERICKEFIETDIKGKVLNIGAGEVRWLENDLFLCKSNFISSDIDAKNLGEHNMAKNKIVIDATSIPFKNGELSEVIILDVLEHIKDHEKAISEINRVLKKGGVLIISVPNDTLLSYLNPIRYAQHERHYNISQIKDLLEKNGFRVEKIFSGGGIFELLDLYTHLFVKYTTGKMINFKIFNKLRDKEYNHHRNNGDEIIIKAIKK